VLAATRRERASGLKESNQTSLGGDVELVSRRFHAMRSGQKKPVAASAPATTGHAGEDSVPPALAQLLSFADNAINLPLLLKQLKTRVGVVPFVGAEMSVPFGFPAWRPFLETQAPNETARQRVVELLVQGKYEEAAETLLAARGENAFQPVLEDTFGEHRLPEPLPPAAIVQLPRLCSGPAKRANAFASTSAPGITRAPTPRPIAGPRLRSHRNRRC